LQQVCLFGIWQMLGVRLLATMAGTSGANIEGVSSQLLSSRVPSSRSSRLAVTFGTSFLVCQALAAHAAWQFRKLYCIRNHLSGAECQKEKDVGGSRSLRWP